MKIIKSSVEEIKQEDGLDGIYKTIEIAGRNCWKSEEKTCDGSALKMFENLKKRQHGSPMEFGTIYLRIPHYNFDICNFYTTNKFTKTSHDGEFLYVTTNMRVIYENHKECDLCFLSEPSKFHEKRRFFRIICDRGILAEVTRHRVFSFCVESTRYCNYQKDKFSNEITVIEPCWCYDKDDYSSACRDFAIWKKACEDSERQYFALLEEGWAPEKARSVLPNSLKTDICICGFESDWEHFFELRCSSAAHPQVREIANMIKNIF